MNIRSRHLATLIRKRRIELDLSQNELNKLLGWYSKNGQVVSNIERGLQQVPAHAVNKLSSAIMIPREEIMDLMVKDYQEALKNEVLK